MNRNPKPYDRLGNGDSSKHLAQVVAGKGPATSETGIPLNAIHVTSDFDLA